MEFLRSSVLVQGDATPTHLARHADSGRPSHLLKRFDAQEGRSLCWAAVTSAMTHYYASPEPNGVAARSQCEVAHTQFPNASCCADLATCDREWSVSEPLYDCRVLDGRRGYGRNPPDFPEVLEHQVITLRRPVVLQVGYGRDAQGRFTRSHFIVVDGAVRLPAVNGWLFHGWDPAPRQPPGTPGTAWERSWMGLNAYFGRDSGIVAMYLTKARGA